MRGPVNLVALNPVTNDEFAHTHRARARSAGDLSPVPSFALKLVMGEMAEDTVLASQRVVPRRLLDAASSSLSDARIGAALEIGKHAAG